MADLSNFLTQFSHDLTTLGQRIAALQASEATAPAATTLLQEAVEELLVTEEELREQHEELLVTRHDAEAAYERYATLLALVPDGHVVTDALGIIAEANPAVAALFDVSQEVLIGKPLALYVAQGDRRAFRTQLSRLPAQGWAQDWELHFQPRHGRPFPAEIMVSVGRGAGESEVMLYWFIRDLTAWKQLAAERQRTERRALLGQLGTGVAHAMRNPLEVLFLHTDLLEDKLQQAPPACRAPIAACLTEIKTDLTRLHEVVENYLALACLEFLQRAPTDLGGFVTAFAREMQQPCVARGLTLRLEGIAALGTVALHHQTFRRVLLNLVQNALDAMPAGRTLTLSGQRTTTQLTLAVRDTGSGIPAEQLSQLFTPLHTTKTQGTGLGLYVAREIVTAHGGTLTVQSGPDHGTTATITLPHAAPAAP